jgi:hypothetical protein
MFSLFNIPYICLKFIKMISNILKSLSDTEIMAIAEQLSKKDCDDQMVYKQLIAKGNDGEILVEMYHEMNSDYLRGTLPRMVALEISNRYRSLIEEFSIYKIKVFHKSI